jgi:hypothetical protein
VESHRGGLTGVRNLNVSGDHELADLYLSVSWSPLCALTSKTCKAASTKSFLGAGNGMPRDQHVASRFVSVISLRNYLVNLGDLI